MLNGEQQTREKFVELIEAGLAGDGIKLPEIPGVDPTSLVISQAQPTPDAGLVCSPEDPTACEVSAPIYAAYFYQTGCKECARAETDLAYLNSKYPQLIIEEFNIYDEAAMAEWMAERVGVEKNFNTPALFIGDHAWIDESEFTPAAIEPVLEELRATGSPDFWTDYNPNEGNTALISRFEQMGWLAVVLAGLVDGLNPCAFATIIFFVSYLSLSGKKGKEILITGASFSIGVFIAYLLVGLGFYKVLDLISGFTSIISKIVYILTAVVCLVLAVLSIRDFIKVRQGDLNDMALKLPEPLRKRINQTVREGRKASSYFLGAFVTGLLISLLELACTANLPAGDNFDEFCARDARAGHVLPGALQPDVHRAAHYRLHPGLLWHNLKTIHRIPAQTCRSGQDRHGNRLPALGSLVDLLVVEITRFT